MRLQSYTNQPTNTNTRVLLVVGWKAPNIAWGTKIWGHAALRYFTSNFTLLVHQSNQQLTKTTTTTTPALTVLAQLPGSAPAVRSLSGYLPASAGFATIPRSGRCISSTAASSAPSGASARPVRAPFRCPWSAPGVGCRWAARFASRTRATRTRHCATQPGAVAAAALAIEIHEAAAATASGTPRRHCCGVPSGLRDRRRHRLSCRHALNGSCCRWRPGGSWWRCFPQNSVKRGED